MRLYDFQITETEGRLKSTCRAEWETAERPATTIEFWIAEEVGIAPLGNPEAFLLAAAVPAAAAGEERIWVDGAVCGLLLESIPSALAILKTWFPEHFPSRALPHIEVAAISDILDEPSERPAAFYSGGVDSTHLLLANAQDFPVGHPNRIECGICVYGCDMGGQIGQDGSQAFSLLLSQSRPLLDALGVRQLPVYTNLRHLDDRPGFWGEVFVGFALSAVAHVLEKRFSQIFMATTGEPLVEAIQAPFGNHPSLTPYTNSRDVRITNPYLTIQRLQRIRLIAQYPVALSALRVCYFCNHGAELNCGVCEKCVRTQLGLLLCGIDPAPYFGEVQVDAALLDRTDIGSLPAKMMFLELRDGMASIGRHDLRDAIDRQLKRFEQYQRWRQGKTLSGRLRKMLSGVAG